MFLSLSRGSRRVGLVPRMREITEGRPSCWTRRHARALGGFASPGSSCDSPSGSDHEPSGISLPACLLGGARCSRWSASLTVRGWSPPPSSPCRASKTQRSWSRHRTPVPGTGRVARVPWCMRASFWLAYRVRRPINAGRGVSVVVARSDDGVSFETVCEIHRELFGADSFERPVLLPRPEGGWRLYVSCASPDRSTGGSKPSTPMRQRSWPQACGPWCYPVTRPPRSRIR